MRSSPSTPKSTASDEKRWRSTTILSLRKGNQVVVAGDGHVGGGERALRELPTLAPPVTALVCYNDLTAIGAMRAAAALGRRLPRDLSVIGFDDVDLAALVEPPLTTVVQDTPAMGRWAVEQLTQRLADPGGEAQVVRLTPTLCVRASTAPYVTDAPR